MLYVLSGHGVSANAVRSVPGENSDFTAGTAKAVTFRIIWRDSVNIIWRTLRVWTNLPASRNTSASLRRIGFVCSSLILNRTSRCSP